MPPPGSEPTTGSRTVVDQPVARVLPLLGMPHLDRLFDYAVPPELEETAVPGVRVRVRFAGRLVDAVLIERRSNSDHRGRLAPLTRVLGETPVVPPRLWELVNSLADRYAGVRSDILRSAVPSRHASAEKAGLFGRGADWEQLYGALESVEDLRAAAHDAALAGWSAYRHADSLLGAVLDGRGARASWLWTPGENWAARTAEFAATVAWSGGGVLLVVPDQRDVDRLTEALRRFLSAAQITELTASVGPAARYRRYLSVLAGQGRVVVGTRSAATVPVPGLRLIMLTGDADESLVDPRAPYIHAREVLRLRALQEGCGFIVGGVHRSAEVQQWVEDGFCPTLRADPEVLRGRMPWIHALDDLHDAHAAHTRIPASGYRAIRRSLDGNLPVLIQVPRRGYAPALACAACRAPARCRRCNGPLELPADTDGTDAAAVPRCRWCGAPEYSFSCPTCGGHSVRMTVVGTDRTAEELGRAFPGSPVVVSGGGHVRDSVPDGPRIVVATPGAEPVVSGNGAGGGGGAGYGAAILVDPWLTLGRADLRAAEGALRQWMEAARLVVPREQGGEVLVVARPDIPEVQALIRWDPEGAAAGELRSRREARFPPASVLVAVDGTAETVRELREILVVPPELEDLEVLGPVDLPPGVRPPAGLGESELHLARRLILRTARQSRSPTAPADPADPTADPAADPVVLLGSALRSARAVRATRRLTGPLRIVVDPVRVG